LARQHFQCSCFIKQPLPAVNYKRYPGTYTYNPNPNLALSLP